MKILIAGLGSIGRRHLRNLRQCAEDVEVLLYRTRQSTLPEDELAGYPVETELDAALAQHPDGVIVANPTSLHLNVAIPAAQAGCHILLEKPVSHSFEGLTEFSRVVEQSGVKVLVGYQFRFHPLLRQAAVLLAEGAIGQPLSVRAHWGEYLPGWHPWEDYRQSYSARAELGGGVVLTLSHPLDYLRWLFGEMESLWAFAGQQSGLQLDVEGVAEIGLRFRTGLLGTVHLDYYQRPPAHYLEIIGSQGTLRWDSAEDGLQLFRPQNNGQDHAQIAREVHPLPTGFERNHMFVEEMRHFLNLIRSEEQPVCTLDDGIQAQRIALAALESAARGTLVRLDRPLQAELMADLPQVQALVLDFDGVFTDNRVIVNEDGREAVLADRSDGMGIARLRDHGLPILVLSTETNPVVLARAKKLGIECLQGMIDKAAALRKWLSAQEQPIDPAGVIYVGNDINDLQCLEMVGMPVAVADAHPAVLQRASLILQHSGGKGAVREICDLILSRRIHV